MNNDISVPMYEGYEVFVRRSKGTYAYPYISKIVGTHPQYHFARIFLQFSCFFRSIRGWYYEIDLMEDGVYEVGIKRWNSETKELLSRDVYWFTLSDGKIIDICKDDVLALIKDVS